MVRHTLKFNYILFLFELKTLKYIQTNVHDFAWFADKRFIVKHDTCHLASGKIIDAYTFYTPTESETWKNSLQTVKDAIRTRSEWIGEYPYKVVSAVQGPEGFGGGMEYPTITLISPQANEKLLSLPLRMKLVITGLWGPRNK
jgi:hypothetical protein